MCGHHNTIYPVELPQWLPSDVVKGMLAQFEQLLLDKIHTMEKEKTCKHFHVSSWQSNFAMSTASHDSIYPTEVCMAMYDD